MDLNPLLEFVGVPLGKAKRSDGLTVKCCVPTCERQGGVVGIRHNHLPIHIWKMLLERNGWYFYEKDVPICPDCYRRIMAA